MDQKTSATAVLGEDGNHNDEPIVRQIKLLSNEAMQALVRHIEKLNVRARKLGVPEISMRVVGSEAVNAPTYSEHDLQSLEDIDPEQVSFMRNLETTVEITGRVPRLSGWRFLAKIDHVEGVGNIVHSAKSRSGRAGRDSSDGGHGDVPYRLFHSGPHCDHCGMDRQRKTTVVLMSDHRDIKQVGSTCLGAFLGVDDPLALEWYAGIFDVFDDMEAQAKEPTDELRALNRQDALWDVEEVIRRSVAFTQLLGFVSREKAEGSVEKTGSPLMTTSNHVRLSFMQPPDVHAADKEFNRKLKAQLDKPETEQFAKEVIAWVRDWPDDVGTFQHNAKTLCVSGATRLKEVGFLACLPNLYSRHLSKEAERQAESLRPRLNEHQGQPSEPLTQAVKIQKIAHFPGVFGSKTLITMKDSEGRSLIWWSSKGANATPVQCLQSQKDGANVWGSLPNPAITTPNDEGREAAESETYAEPEPVPERLSETLEEGAIVVISGKVKSHDAWTGTHGEQVRQEPVLQTSLSHCKILRPVGGVDGVAFSLFSTDQERWDAATALSQDIRVLSKKLPPSKTKKSRKIPA